MQRTEEVKSKEGGFTYRKANVIMTGRSFTSVPIGSKVVDNIIFAVCKMKWESEKQ